MKMTDENIILLAEDNSDDIGLIRRQFEKSRIENQLMVIQGGKEVLEYLFRRGAYKDRKYSLPSLILLSLNLPKLGGVEVLEKIRQDRLTSSIPVLVLISHESEKTLVEEQGLNVEGYIQKPLGMAKLKEAVEKLDFSWTFGPEKME